MALMLFSATGMVIMTTANDLIVVFLALEVLSIPLYVLAAFDRRRRRSQEAGIKYFVLGAFSSAIFLYGIALVYGATGTTSLTGIADFLANTLFDPGTLLAGIVLLLVGPRFQGGGGAVPHVDARRLPGRAHAGHRLHGVGHQGRRVRGAAAHLHRVPALPDHWRPAVWGLAVLTLVVGSIGALLQTDLKRMLAYSSIPTRATCSSGSRPAPPQGLRGGALLPVRVHVHGVGSFAVVTVSARRRRPLHQRLPRAGVPPPVLGGLLVLFMLAQAGIPLTGGFIAKLDVFASVANNPRSPTSAGTRTCCSWSA